MFSMTQNSEEQRLLGIPDGGTSKVDTLCKISYGCANRKCRFSAINLVRIYLHTLLPAKIAVPIKLAIPAKLAFFRLAFVETCFFQA